MTRGDFSSILAALLTAASLAAQGPSNDCTHNYWAPTLRCQALSLTGSTEPPQPNATDRPASVAELKEYTRVFLPNRNLRCLDGTRPLLYVAQAKCTDPAGCLQPNGKRAQYGDSIVSHDWIISFPGGGACSAQDVDGDGVYEDGTDCTGHYVGEAPEMSSGFDPPMTNLAGEGGTSGGILSRDPARNPVFAAWNSVRVEKCSFDRYNGRAQYAGVQGELFGNSFSYTVFHHGQLIAEAAVQNLISGLQYTSWADVNGDGIVDEVRVRLPSLANARKVLFIGHSGSAHGLRHNIDRLADMVRNVRPSVDVRALFDANFLPSIEGEAAHNGSGGDAYTNQWTGVSATAAGGMFTYDGRTFYRYSFASRQLTAWRTLLDESCVSSHSPATRWKCRDRQHVLFNHIETPMFVREDFRDPNDEHTDGGQGHRITWALPPGCAYPDPEDPLSSCLLRFDPATEHRDRLTQLVKTLLGDIRSRSEIAQLADMSLGVAGHAASVYMWMPSCASHEGAYRHESFYGTSILDSTTGSSVSMHDALVSFLASPRLDAAEWRIDGTVGGRTMTSLCPP